MERGTPFRSAHAIVGEVVRRSLGGEGSLVSLVRAHDRLGDEPASLLEPGTPVKRRTTPGSAGPVAVAEQLDALQQAIDDDVARLSDVSGTSQR